MMDCIAQTSSRGADKLIGLAILGVLTAIGAAVVYLFPRRAERIGWVVGAIGLLCMAASPIMFYARGQQQDFLEVWPLIAGFVISCIAGSILLRST